MTEKIQQAIDKLDKEAEQLGSTYYMLIASHIIDNYLKTDVNADKVLAEEKTLEGCFEYIRSNAKKEAVNNCAMVDDAEVFCWAGEYYEFTDLQSTANNHIDLFDVL